MAKRHPSSYFPTHTDLKNNNNATYSGFEPDEPLMGAVSLMEFYFHYLLENMGTSKTSFISQCSTIE